MKTDRPHVLVMLTVALALVGVACSSGGGSTPGRALRVGDAAPGFDLPSATGGRAFLSDFRGRKPVLLYFSMGPG